MRSRLGALLATLFAATLLLSACGSEKPDAKPEKSDSPSAAATTEDAPEETPAASGSYKAAAWAAPITSKGDKLGTIKGKTFSVDVFQVAKGKADEDSMFVDRDTKKNLMPKGTPTVFLNFVVTNTSSEPVLLSSSLVGITGKYEDWKYMSGMPGESHSSVFESFGLDSRGKKIGEDAPYSLGAGESYNQAQSYFYQGPKKLLLKIRLTPAKPDGDLDFDNKVETEGSVDLK